MFIGSVTGNMPPKKKFPRKYGGGGNILGNIASRLENLTHFLRGGHIS